MAKRKAAQDCERNGLIVVRVKIRLFRDVKQRTSSYIAPNFGESFNAICMLEE